MFYLQTSLNLDMLCLQYKFGKIIKIVTHSTEKIQPDCDLPGIGYPIT